MLESDLDLQYKVLTQCFFSLVDLERREILYSSPADKRIEIKQYWTKISYSKLFRYWYQEHTSFLSSRASLSKFFCIIGSMNSITVTFKKLNISIKLHYTICRIPSKIKLTIAFTVIRTTLPWLSINRTTFLIRFWFVIRENIFKSFLPFLTPLPTNLLFKCSHLFITHP